MQLSRPLPLTLLPLALVLFAATAYAQVVLDWVEIGSPGNACDPQQSACYGAVGTAFRIAKHEVTNAQYVDFLNAVAADDPNELWVYGMSVGSGGISRLGSPGAHGYAVIAGKADWPVIYPSFWSAVRFVNWLHNGQPSGAQGAGTTEDGAYTLSPTAIADNTVTRNPGALYFIPTLDEWHKAAYYDPNGATYYDYPAGFDAQTTCALVGAAANTANCGSVEGGLVDVGSYPGASSPFGTLDQGGNVYEWTETVITAGDRAFRGGAHNTSATELAASELTAPSPPSGGPNQGFRVAAPAGDVVPTLGPAMAALLASVLGVLGTAAQRKRAGALRRMLHRAS